MLLFTIDKSCDGISNTRRQTITQLIKLSSSICPKGSFCDRSNALWCTVWFFSIFGNWKHRKQLNNKKYFVSFVSLLKACVLCSTSTIYKYETTKIESSRCGNLWKIGIYLITMTNLVSVQKLGSLNSQIVTQMLIWISMWITRITFSNSFTTFFINFNHRLLGSASFLKPLFFFFDNPCASKLTWSVFSLKRFVFWVSNLEIKQRYSMSSFCWNT